MSDILKVIKQKLKNEEYQDLLDLADSIDDPQLADAVRYNTYFHLQDYPQALRILEGMTHLESSPVVLEVKAFCKVACSQTADAEHHALATLVRGNADFHSHYTRASVKTNTMPRPNRRVRYSYLTECVAKTNGAMVECGCAAGLSTILISQYGKGSLYVFDSFEGLSDPSQEDPQDKGDSDAGKFAHSLAKVRSNLDDVSNVHLYKGWIPDRFNDLKETAFAFVHVDVDLYQPTKDAIEHFFPMIKSGYLVCDDYNWSGAKKAVDDYSAKNGLGIEITKAGQAILKTL